MATIIDLIRPTRLARFSGERTGGTVSASKQQRTLPKISCRGAPSENIFPLRPLKTRPRYHCIQRPTTNNLRVGTRTAMGCPDYGPLGR